MDEQPQLDEPTPAPVSPTPEPAPVDPVDPEQAQLEADVQASAQGLMERELTDGEPVSDNVAGRWAVYDNSELRFVPGLDCYADQDRAQAELDLVRPNTGHDLVVVQV